MQINTVIIPCLKGDLENLRTLLSCWSDRRTFPLDNDPKRATGRTLLILINNSDETGLELFRDAAAEFGDLAKVFSSIVVESADLTGEHDIYVRNSEFASGQFGNKAGPNFLFFRAMERAKKYGGFALQCEVDCYPLARGWLDYLESIIGEHPSAWVIGSNYGGFHAIHDRIQLHINGNALYNVGDLQFQDFIRNVWQKRLFELVRIDPNLAYDCWWSIEVSRASGVLKNRSWHLVNAFGSRFVNRPMVINLLHEDSFLSDMDLYERAEILSGRKYGLIHSSYIRHQVANFLTSETPDLIDHLKETSAEHSELSANLAHDLEALVEPVENELVFDEIQKLGQTVDGDYGDISVKFILRDPVDQSWNSVVLRFQILGAERFIEFRPMDNPTVLVDERYQEEEDDWGPYIRISLNDASVFNLGALVECVGRMEGQEGDRIALAQVFLSLMRSWSSVDKVLTSFAPGIWSASNSDI